MKVRNKKHVYKEGIYEYIEHLRTVSVRDGSMYAAVQRRHNGYVSKHNGIDIRRYTVAKNDKDMLYMWALHRVGSPAQINNPHGDIRWWVMGTRYRLTKEYCAACNFSDMNTLTWVLKYGDNLPTRLDQL